MEHVEKEIGYLVYIGVRYWDKKSRHCYIRLQDGEQFKEDRPMKQLHPRMEQDSLLLFKKNLYPGMPGTVLQGEVTKTDKTLSWGNMKYLGRWAHEPDRMRWQAETDAAEQERNHAKMAKYGDEISQALEPIKETARKLPPMTRALFLQRVMWEIACMQ